MFKWAPGGNSARRYLKLQGEYMHRRRPATWRSTSRTPALVGLATAARSPAGTCRASTSSRRAGARACATTRSIPALRRSGWSIPALLPAEAFPALLPGDPTRTTVMLDWNPSEFSRWRLQYAWDEARDDGDNDQQLQLQYLFGIGAHGAHKY